MLHKPDTTTKPVLTVRSGWWLVVIGGGRPWPAVDVADSHDDDLPEPACNAIAFAIGYPPC